jgi:alkanesulfonate monooxygenase SsuD/methylene tetrahydromethanopterin reductase-like flavin-dependent oxidoreductase (luciferase family)
VDVGIGLPNAVSSTTRQQLLDWARAAEQAGFSSLGTIDRIVYPNYEPIIALSAAAAVTDRIRLATSVLLGPLRMNPAIIAKQMLSLDAIAGGDRAVLGIGLGGREDDYRVSGASISERGAWQDRALAQIRQIFDGTDGDDGKIGPRPQRSGPSLIIGGSVPATFRRAARYGDGWIMGGGAPDQFANGAQQLQAAWTQQGRTG